MLLFTKSVLIGLAIAAPVGPIGLLCIQRTLQQGLRTGLASGLGAATADALYAILGVSGLSALIVLLVDYREVLNYAGLIFLLYLGGNCIRSARSSQTHTVSSGGVGAFKAFSSCAVLTLANPMTVLAFSAVFASLGQLTADTDWPEVTVVSGVFIGSCLWWLVLCISCHLFKHKIQQAQLEVVNIIAGAVLLGFAFFQLLNLLR
ncbi:MAG: LysE family translocator [Pseudomonadales bacterium]